MITASTRACCRAQHVIHVFSSCVATLGCTSTANCCCFRNSTSLLRPIRDDGSLPDSSHALTAAFYRVWDEISNMRLRNPQRGRASNDRFSPHQQASRRLVGWPPPWRDRPGVDDSAGQPGWSNSCFPGSRSPAACPSTCCLGHEEDEISLCKEWRCKAVERPVAAARHLV